MKRMFAGCTFTSTDVPLHTSATLLFDKDRSAFFECGFDRAAVQYLEVSSHVAVPGTAHNLCYRRGSCLMVVCPGNPLLYDCVLRLIHPLPSPARI